MTTSVEDTESKAYEANRKRILLQAAFAPHREAFQKAQRALRAIPLKKRNKVSCAFYDTAVVVYEAELAKYQAQCDALGVDCFE
jgi:hypothetical protein